MKIPSVLKNASTFLDKNSPVILTGLALAGLVGTTYLTYRGTHEATLEIIDREEKNGNVGLPTQEKFLATYKFYAPAAVTLVGTGACMIMATKIGLNRTAALGAALVIAERGQDQYRDKVKEIFGENKDAKVRDAIAADQVEAMPSHVFVGAREGEQVFVDGWSGRAFFSTMETVKGAVNDFNAQLLYGDFEDLTSFYKLIGLESTQESGNIGFNRHNLMELNFTSVLRDGKAVVYFEFSPKPKSNFRLGDV